MRTRWISDNRRCSFRIDICAALLLFLSLADSAAGQVPERLRIDVSIGSLSAARSEAFLGGYLAPRVGLLPPLSALVLADVSATFNVSQKLTVSAGVPAGLAVKPDFLEFTEDRTDGGMGDAHGEVVLSIIGERWGFPGLAIRVEGGAPTATLAFMGNGLWRTTGGATVSKSFHPRFLIFADGSYSHFLEERDLKIDPIKSAALGMGIGVSEAWMMTLQAEEIRGGGREENGKSILPAQRDLRAGIGFTGFSKGCPRLSFSVSVGNLRGEPTLLLGVRFTVLSL